MGKTWFDRLCDFLERATLWACSILVVTMLLVACWHIIRRYILNNALTWSEEFLRFSLVWFALLSASVIFKRRGHIGIVIFREKMPKRVQDAIGRTLPFMALVVTSITSYEGFALLGKVKGQFTPALRIPVSWPYAAIPVGFLLMSVYGVQQILEDSRHRRSSDLTEMNG